MNDVEKLRTERAQNVKDIYNNKIPKRVPCSVGIGLYAAAEYGNIDPKEAYWDFGKLEGVADELCAKIPSDGCVVGASVLLPAKYQSIGSRSIIMGENGFLQHPNTHMMEEDEYDEFIKDPYAFVVEVAAPRTNKNLDYKKDPVRAMATIHQANSLTGMVMGTVGAVMGKMAAKYGYASGAMGGGGGYAPLDILSDQMRSFSGMMVDIRRNRQKVKDALEAMYPWQYDHCLPPNMDVYTRDMAGFYPLHMATFMREKDFEELWWQPFIRQITDFASLGIRVGAFLEDDWTRYLDYLVDSPTGTYFTFEYADAKKFKEKLGKKFILGGGFPLKHLTTCTKDEIIAETKEWLDIMAPGGQYSFGFDKGALVLKDVDIDNLKAVVETVLSYGVYDNPGQSSGEIFNKDDYSHSKVDAFTSRVFKSWDEYKAEHPNTPESAERMVMTAEKQIRSFYYSLMQ